jgi:hypothetical protein
MDAEVVNHMLDINTLLNTELNHMLTIHMFLVMVLQPNVHIMLLKQFLKIQDNKWLLQIIMLLQSKLLLQFNLFQLN